MRLTLALLALVFASRLSGADKPIPPKDAPSKMTVPPGFKVTLFAGEPDIVQPIAFTFDDRGRMWVVECLSYPKWRDDGKGIDRVVILEDADGNGTFDKKTVVIDNGSNLSGIELGFGGVWLCSTPNLIFVPIKDDKPSGPPEILLDGWNLKEAKHNVFNSLAWGPDGWMYGCNGIQTKSWVGKPGTPQKDRTYMDCGVWRYHPTRKVFEVFATGTTNPWGLDWDEHGELFITNCVIDHLWHVVPGGRYQRMHGQDSNPFAYGLMSSCVDYKHWDGGHWTDARADLKTGALKQAHSDAGGGHAHVGCCIYQGENFPKEYRNTLFTANLHGNRLNNDGLERTPTGMKGIRRPDFLFANDPWFRGLCVKQGPDGALYVSDWTDTGECHNYDVADTTNGRIYRVSYGEPKKFAEDVSKLTKEALREAVLGSNEWLSRKSRLELQKRTAAGENLGMLFEGYSVDIADSRKTIRRMWGQMAVNGIGHAHIQNGIGQVPEIRGALMRFGMADPRFAPITRQTIANHYRPEPIYRRDQAVVLPLFPAEEIFAFAAKLFSHSEDNSDDKLSQLYWLGIQPAVMANPADGLKLVNSIANRRVRTNIVRLVASLPKSDVTKQLESVFPVLLATTTDETRRDILTGLLRALEDQRTVSPPPNWPAVRNALARNDAVRDPLDDLALKFGDEQTIVHLAFSMANDKLPAESRIRAIEKLAPLKQPFLAEGLCNLLNEAKVRGAAIKALALYSDASIPPALLKHYAGFTPTEKADAVLTLSGRKDGAVALLTAVEKGDVPKGDVSSFAARQIQALNDKAISAKLATVWGTVKPASATKAAQTAKLKELLTPDYLKAADLKNGKAVFAKNCASCHKLYGEGNDVGPELTGSQRSNLDYVLENVLDPSAAVPYDLKVTAFYLSDGRVITGLLRKETLQTVTVRTVNDTVVIPAKEIESRKGTNQSLMPDGLLDTMKNEDVRDLIAYLATKEAPK